MADLISLNQLANASVDAQTLADAINGNEQLDVISRLGAKYPTLAKAIKTIMQKAPINSTPFATKAALLADTTLADGAFAFVYNDTDDKNGLYQKTNRVWAYLKYNYTQKLNLLTDTVNLESNTFYYSSDGVNLIRESNPQLEAVGIDVKEGEYFSFKTSTWGVVGAYYVTDSNGRLIAKMESNENQKINYLIKIPSYGTKLYVNRAKYFTDFHLVKIPMPFIELFYKDKNLQLATYYTASGNQLSQAVSNQSLFSKIIDVKADDFYLINTKSFGIANEYYIVDVNNNVLTTKAPSDSEKPYLIKIPTNSVKLIVNCGYDYFDKFKVEQVANALMSMMPNNKLNASNVQNYFPKPTYFDLVRQKCPTFYQKFKGKNEDVTVVLTGTSLTQGNLYATDRADATTRPPALHTNDFASAVFDKLIKHWDGQKYRRYDQVDLTYSSSTWQVINQLRVNGVDIWDDYAYRKNGLTKTTTDANASVSMTIPADAWQFNFIYRSDSQGGNCTVSISQGNGLAEAFNGTAWVEANGFVFSSLEPSATATKGNTIYQKRLKMRCKDKSGGINSIGQTKTITISKGNDTTRFNVVGFEWSPREFMLTVVNSARGSHQWGMGGFDLANYQDNDIWQFNPDLLLAEISIINWSASEPSALNVDPLFYVNAAKRGYFNEFNDFPNALYSRLQAYGQCDVVFYSDTLACTWAVADAWDSATHEPKFGTVTSAATNGATVSNENMRRVKTNFENYEAVERYVASKDFLFIPVLGVFKEVAQKYYGSYWQAMQPTGKDGNTLSYDGVHFNDNGAALLSSIVASVFDQL